MSALAAKPPGASYSDVALASLVDGASPHRLVEILYEELLKSLDSLIAARARGVAAQAGRAATRSKTILAGLDAGLDLDAGGPLGETLRRFYRGAAARLSGQPSADELTTLRDQVAGIHASWSAIAAR